MNLKQLHYLTALHSTLSFTLGAKQCGVSQSTFSGGIAALETALGAQLVERDPKHVLFTEVGLGVIERARPLLSAAQDLEAYADSANEPMQGQLTLAAIPSIAPFLLTPLILSVRQKYPKLRLMLREMQSAPLLAKLRDGSLDVGLIALPYDTAGLHLMPLFNEPLMLIAASNDELAAVAQPTLAHLDPNRLILLQEGHCLREHTLQSCSFTERSTAAIEASSLPTLVQMVEAGLGVALLPEMAVNSRLIQPALASGAIIARAFAKPAPTRGIALVTRNTHSRKQAFEAIAQLIQDVHKPKRKLF